MASILDFDEIVLISATDIFYVGTDLQGAKVDKWITAGSVAASVMAITAAEGWQFDGLSAGGHILPESADNFDVGQVGLEFREGHFETVESSLIRVSGVSVRNATILTSGTLADARVAASNVTQHQGALVLTASQISDWTADFNTDFDIRLATKNTGDLTEGVNLYYTDGRWDARMAASNSGQLAEGSNLYFTTARVDAQLDVDQTIAGEWTFGGSLNIEGGGAQFQHETGDPSGVTGYTRVHALAGDNLKYRDGIGTLYQVAARSWVDAHDWTTGDITDWSAQFNSDFDTRLAGKSTSNLQEGTNLYYTTIRANVDFDTRIATKSTTDLAEGTNQYHTDERVDDRVATLIQNGTGITWTYGDPGGTLTGAVSLSPFTTTDLTEGAGLYFTDERVDDRVSALLQNGGGITWTYDDILGTLTPGFTLASYTTSNLSEGTNLYFTDERVDDRAASLVQNGTGLTWAYDDGLGTLTGTVSLGPFSTTDLSEGTNLYWTDGRFDTRLASKTTTDLAEGTNLWFTTARVDAQLDTAQSISGAWTFTSSLFTEAAIQFKHDTADPYAGTIGYHTVYTNAGDAFKFRDGQGTIYHLASRTWVDAHTWVAGDITDWTSVFNTDFDARLATKSTTNVAEGTNLYYTTGRANTDFDTRLGTKSTTDLAEGSNLWYTDVRADARISLQKAAANGLATLGADSKIPTSQLPSIALVDTSVVASQVAMLALTAQTGDVAVRTDTNVSYILAGADPSVLGDWQELLTPTDTVLSVNGFTGAVTLTTSDIGEGTNLYWTDTRWQTAWGLKTTSHLPEGSNLYYTDSRVDTRLDTAQTITNSWTFSAGIYVDDPIRFAHETGDPFGGDSGYTTVYSNAGDSLKYKDGAGAVYQVASRSWVDAHVWDASDITTGIFADARIAASNVTQHQAALSITEIQISDFGSYGTAAAVALNTTHRTASDGSDHTFIDQSVVSGATPTFTATNITGVPAASVLAGTFGTGAFVFDGNVTLPEAGAGMLNLGSNASGDNSQIRFNNSLGAVDSQIGVYETAVSSVLWIGSNAYMTSGGFARRSVSYGSAGFIADTGNFTIYTGDNTGNPVSALAFDNAQAATFSGDVGGIGTLTATSLEGTLTTAAQANVTSVGALNGGSITSGFGAINNGGSGITTTGAVSGGSVLSTGVVSATLSTDGVFNALDAYNASAGTAAITRLRLGNNQSPNALTIDVYGTNHATFPWKARILNQNNAALQLGGYGTHQLELSTGAAEFGSSTITTTGTLAAGATTVTGLSTFVTGATTNVLIGTDGAYNTISLNGTLATATKVAITAGGSGDTGMYFDVPAAAAFNFRSAYGVTRLSVSDAGAAVTGTLSATGTITQGGTAVSLVTHSHALADLSNVQGTPTDTQTLSWNNTGGYWEPANAGGGGDTANAVDETIAGAWTFSDTLTVGSNGMGQMHLYSPSSTTDTKYWAIQYGNDIGNLFRIRALDDALSTGANALTIARSGTTVGAWVLSGTSFGFGAGTITTTGTATTGNIVVSGTSAEISTSTSDTSDNASLFLEGGGGFGTSRGAYIALRGNEVASVGGDVEVYSGIGGDIAFLTDEGGGAVAKLTISNTGTATFTGNIVVTGTVDGIDIATDVAANTTHRSSDGSDHTFIDQSVVSGATPTFTATNITGVPAASVLAGTFGTGAYKISSGASGATADTAANVLVAEHSTHGGISILTPNSVSGALYFGDPEDNNAGRIVYNHADDSMSFLTDALGNGGSSALVIDASMNVAFAGDVSGIGTLTATSLAGALTTAAQTNITSVGALNGGSITSGFGAIDNGASSITTTGTLSAGDSTLGHIVRPDDASGYIISGGTGQGNGSNIILYGSGHATQAHDMTFRASGIDTLGYDYSATAWDFQANSITTTGTLGSGAITVTNANIAIVGTGTSFLVGGPVDAVFGHTGNFNLDLHTNGVSRYQISLAGAHNFKAGSITTTGAISGAAGTFTGILRADSYLYSTGTAVWRDSANNTAITQSASGVATNRNLTIGNATYSELDFSLKAAAVVDFGDAVITTTGDLLVGAATTVLGAQVYATRDYSAASGTNIGSYHIYTQSVATTGELRGMQVQLSSTHTTGTIVSQTGLYVASYALGATANTTTTQIGIDIGTWGSSHVNATVTTAKAINIPAASTTGTVTNRWALYQEGANDSNYFAGDVRVNATSASALAEELTVNGNGIAFTDAGGMVSMFGSFGGANMILGTYSNDQVDIRTNNTLALSIDTSQNATFAGNVTLTAGALSVTDTATLVGTFNSSAANGPYIRLQESAVTKFFVGARAAVSGGGGTGYDIYTVAGNDLRLWTAATVALTIDTSQNTTFAGNVTVGGLDADTSRDLIFADTGGDEWFIRYDAGELLFVESGIITRLRLADGGGATFAGALYSASGSVTLPAFSFDGDANTGMYQIAGDTLGFSTGGTLALTIGPSQAATFAGALTSGVLNVNSVATALNTAFDSTATGGAYVSWSESTTVRGYVGGGAQIFTAAAANSFGMRAQGNLYLGSNGDNIALTIDASQNSTFAGIVFMDGGAVAGSSVLATTATDGFLYIPTCAGAPTGTPTSQTGTVPMVYDTTNKVLYIYAGGAWVAVGAGGGGGGGITLSTAALGSRIFG
jgi:hypothetical protein